MKVELDRKDADIEQIAKNAADDEALLQVLLANQREKNETIRYNSYKALRLLAQRDAERLYPHWDFLVELLQSNNTYHKLSALMLIADLTAVDREGRFEGIFDQYYGLLRDRSMVVANYVCLASGTIARAKPALRERITELLLAIDSIEQRHKDLIKGAILEAFDTYFKQSPAKDRMLGFARAAREGESPKTRKLAKGFLEKWSD